MPNNFFELPDFDEEILKEIRTADIEIGGKECRKRWDENKIDIDYIRESYEYRRHVAINNRMIAEGKKTDKKYDLPLWKKCCEKVGNPNDFSNEEFEKRSNEFTADYRRASTAVMRFISKKLKEHRANQECN